MPLTIAQVQSSVLPTGAATSAKQPALGTAGTPSADVISVQGEASMTPLKVDGSAVTQPVSGTVAVSGTVPVSIGGTVTVSGTVTANAGTGTLAVSAASLPLPSGASTSAKQPALGTAGSPSTDVLTVQGATSMTPLKVDGSGVTQPISGTVSLSGTSPVSGTVTANQGGTWTVQPGNTANTTAWKVDGSAVTQPVSGTVGISGTVPISGTVTANIGTSGSLALDTTLTGGSQQTKITDGTNVASVKAASTAAVAADKAVVVAISPNNTVPVSLTSTTITGTVAVSGTVTANAGTGTMAVSAASLPLPSGAATSANQTTLGNHTTKVNDGTNTAAVKAASTAAAATDPALVVAVSPNNTVAVTAPTLTKGTQGANGWSVQELKDSGRTAIMFYATGVASGTTTTETAITLNKSAGTGATSSAASFVITNGKTFRITSIVFGSRGNATATAEVTKFSLRLNTGGAVTTSSTPVLLAAQVATPATALAYDRISIEIPDGYEIAGNGTIQIGLTANATFVTNAPTWDALIVGYEY